MKGLRWLTVVAPVIAVAIIEIVSDGLLDSLFPFPLDTIVVVVLVGVLAWVFSTLAFRRIDRLSDELRARNTDLARREASAAALHRVSVAIAAMDDLGVILGTIVGQARDLLSVDVALLLTTGDDGEDHVAAASGPLAGVDTAGGFPGVGLARFVRPDLIVARIEAPLQRAGETTGRLVVGCRHERGFEVDELETLSSLANQAAIAIENARLHARLRELAVVAERERIAREMHDGLAQVLGYVNTKTQAVDALLVAGRTREARIQLGELAAAARSIYVDVREAILGLRSPVVPGLGIVGAVEAYAERFTEASKIVVRVVASHDARRVELAPAVEAQTFRIVQEALTNVRKHSGARRAELRFALHDGRVDIRIADDGQGSSGSDGGVDRPHYGLPAMRERATSIGATVDWSSPPGGGWEVHIAVSPHGPAAVAAGIV
jgi:signal transduction histidine kinase